jgi:hypothetical protein
MAAFRFCLTSIATIPVPSVRKIRKISLGCDAFFQFWNMNGKRHEIAITELERVRTSAIWQVELFTGYLIDRVFIMHHSTYPLIDWGHRSGHTILRDLC